MTLRTFDIQVKVRGRTLVDARDLCLADGGITFLFGESGIGKSLAGKALFGLLEAGEYHVRINGEPYQKYRRSVEFSVARENGFFVFQEPSSHLDPLQTLESQLREGRLSEARDPVAPAFELWSADNLEVLPRILPVFPKPHRPSGGEKQRILGAMAFAKMDACMEQRADGGLFVFDEPTGSLDREARDLFLNRLFARYRRKGETLLIITHDYGIIGYVQSSHPDLLLDIRFSEMRIEHSIARVRTFDADRFFRWLRNQRPLSAASAGRILLRVQSGVRIFGRTLCFQKAGSDEARVDLAVRAGELVYLKAGSGTGKTTIAKIVMGLQTADYVRMDFEGILMSESTPRMAWQSKLWGRRMTMAFQHADEALNPNASVEETLRLLPLAALRTGSGVVESLGTIFDPMEIPQLMKRKVWQLSGGQKQRLNLLRAFTLSTPLIILDEPLSALDFESIDRVLLLIREALGRGQSILLISHNEDIFDELVPAGSVYQLKEVGE
jgi:peptide/nickel transport system ATP-binding protein